MHANGPWKCTKHTMPHRSTNNLTAPLELPPYPEAALPWTKGNVFVQTIRREARLLGQVIILSSKGLPCFDATAFTRKFMGLEPNFDPIPLQESRLPIEIPRLARYCINAMEVLRTQLDNQARLQERYSLISSGSVAREFSRVVLETALGCSLPAARPDWLNMNRHRHEINGFNIEQKLAFDYINSVIQTPEALALMSQKVARCIERDITLIQVPSLNGFAAACQKIQPDEEKNLIRNTSSLLAESISPQWQIVKGANLLLSEVQLEEIGRRTKPILKWARNFNQRAFGTGVVTR
jgi:hypothetical protein